MHITVAPVAPKPFAYVLHMTVATSAKSNVPCQQAVYDATCTIGRTLLGKNDRRYALGDSGCRKCNYVTIAPVAPKPFAYVLQTRVAVSAEVSGPRQHIIELLHQQKAQCHVSTLLECTRYDRQNLKRGNMKEHEHWMTVLT